VIRVLLVDDDSLVRSGLTFMLASTDDITVVGEASDGAAGVSLARSLRPDVVLMDLRMSGMDGRTATAHLRALPDPPQVLALTTFDVDAQVLGVLEAGASGYLVKDTPPLEIIEAIRETARGGAVLSARHARVLIDRFSDGQRSSRRETAHARVAVLTAREKEVARAVGAGHTNAEIAELLHCSPSTVKAHLGSVFTALNVQNRVQLAIIAYDAGLLDDER
jgi:DNA-binding NarL/FixJ family response regulator